MRRSQARQSPASTPRKVVLVGDHTVGKTTLMMVFASAIFPEPFRPSVYDSSEVQVHVDEHTSAHLFLWDVSTPHDYPRLRPLSYPGTNAFILCFSVGDPQTLASVESEWLPEIRHHCPHTPIVLVGCRKDLRGDPEIVAELARVGWHPVTYEEGLQMAQRIGASQYLECSAIQNDGVIDVFKAATLQSLSAPSARTTRSHCRLL
ncbi:GTP-binding protein of the rho subfamily of ras-like protein [Zopfochytrium polystomum]|nr:GTP-binding protein of the rho subfamily of ras-like protein [Zopfochytrium polystomum]